MPTRTLRLSRAEAEVHRRRLLRLGEMGISTDYNGDFLCEDTGEVGGDFELHQIDPCLAQVFVLPGELAVKVRASLLVRAGGTLITASEMAIPWYSVSLDLSDPEDSPFYRDMISDEIPFPPVLLNPYLTGESPLRHGRRDGLIFAMGSLPAPPNIPLQIVPVELVLQDDAGNDYCFNFEARLNHALKAKHERRKQANRPACHERRPLFEREDKPFGNPGRTAKG